MVVKGSWPLRVRGGTAPKSSAPGWALLLLPTALHLGCGARTSLDPGAGGAHVVQHGDKNSEAVATSASFASTGSGMVGCPSLELVEPVIALPTPAPAVRSPEVGIFPDSKDAFVTWIEAPTQTSGALRAGRLDAFGSWPPPTFVEVLDLDPGIDAYVTGPGKSEPVALFRRGSGEVVLAKSIVPQVDTMFTVTSGHEPLFARPLSLRHVAAHVGL